MDVSERRDVAPTPHIPPGTTPESACELLDRLSFARTGKDGANGRGMAEENGRNEPFLIGVAGGTASGKTTVCDQIIQRLKDQRVALIAQDSFYRGLTDEEMRDVKRYNFDHPNAFDDEALLQTVRELKRGKSVPIPIYDFKTHQRSEKVHMCNRADVVILEGILILHNEQVRDMLNMKIFVDTDDDVRLARRIQRDTAERGRDVGGVIAQYTQFVKPMFDMFVLPTKKYADVIIPWGRGDNVVAIDLIVQHIRTKLGQHDLRRIYPNLLVIPSNYQIRGMHTYIRDSATAKHDFVFYADRLNRLVVEAGLGHLPFTEKMVTTPTGENYLGVEFCKNICGVSVVRSGEAMETALRACCKSIKIGKILIQRHGDHCKDVIYEKLPKDISKRYVLMMDPVLATGNSATRAVEIVLSKGVPQEKILFLSLIATPEGIHKVCKRFPQLKVLTSEIDERVREDFCVVPGCGEFGDRYFGTDD